MNWADPLLWEVVLGGMIRLATPLLLAAMGELITERSGTINLGIDGIMTAGALSAVIGSAAFGWGGGLVAAAVTGVLYGLAVALAIVKAGANQIITGIAVALIGMGLTAFAFKLWQPSGASVLFVPLVPVVEVPLLVEIPVIGPALFRQNLLTYGGLALLAVLWWALRHSRAGLRLRAVGDDPEGARLQGVAVDRIRAGAIVLGALLMALGGAAITIGFLGSYSDHVVAGRGYVALAIVIIARWSPPGVLLGALLFAFFDSLRLRIPAASLGLPSEVLVMLPYLATLVALVLAARGRNQPRALGRDQG